MKKTFTSSFLGLAISGLLLASCSQMASYENEDLALEQAKADKAGFTLSPFGSSGGENAYILEEYVDCNDHCIEEDGTYYYVQTAEDYNNGNTVTIVTYNTLTHVVYDFSSTTTISSITPDGEATISNINSLTTSISYELTAPWSACDLVEKDFTVTRQTSGQGQGGGVSVDLSTSYNLIGICTSTELLTSTEEPLCVGDPDYTITATVSSSVAINGGILEIWDESNAVVASTPISELVNSVEFDVPTTIAGTYSFTAHYFGAGSYGFNNSESSSIDVVIENCQDCNYTNGSGYVGDTEGENSGTPGDGFNNGWWYAFDITGDATQDVYENGKVIGSATYDAIAGTISITFADGYSLREGISDSVKWYSYADGELPTAGRPIPGKAPDDNKGTSLVINTNGDRYYVIHLDFQKCNLPSPE